MSNVPIISPNLPNSAVVRELVKEKFADTKVVAADAYNQSLSFLREIISIINSITSVSTSVDFDSLNLEPAIDLKSLIRSMPTPPVLTDPTPPLNTFNYAEDAYISTLLDRIKDNLMTLLLGSGSGLGAAAENAMFTRENERDALALQEAKDRLAADWAERGIEGSCSGLSSGFARLDTEYMNAKLTKSRDITVETRKIEIENLRNAMKDAIAIETVLMDYRGKYWDRKLQAAKEIFQEALAIFNASLELIKTKAQIYGAEVSAYAAEIQALVNAAQAEIAIIKGKVDYAVAKANVLLGQINAQIEQLKMKYGMSMQGADAGSRVAAQLAASAWSAVATSAHLSVGDSQHLGASISASESWSHTDNT